MRLITSISVLLAVGCSNSIVSDYTLELEPISPFNQNPFTGATNSALLIHDAQGNTDHYTLGELSTGTVDLNNMPPLDNRSCSILRRVAYITRTDRSDH